MAVNILRDELAELEGRGELIRVSAEVSPDLELASIQRRLYANRGPAVLFERVAGTRFPVVANLYGTISRCEFLFRKTLRPVTCAVQLKADPAVVLRRPLDLLRAAYAGLHSLPIRTPFVSADWQEVRVSDLPQIKSWPDDGGPFITLPQVFTLDPSNPSIFNSNLGMYRIQLGGNEYSQDQEIGLHYQLHRGIGIHHSKAIALQKRLPVSIFVGGPAAHAFSAVMPLPEGLSELVFAGMLAGRNFRYSRLGDHVVSQDADFCILGYVDLNQQKPEGPFGDHLGYYSLKHMFPVLKVERVLAKHDAIWPFTVVGRPPQEDTSFGEMIHRITAPMVPVSLPGVKALHAVDAAGVHPLLLAIGSERYAPYERERRPQELLTIGNAILGFGQCSLAKYLLLLAQEDVPNLDIHDVQQFFAEILKRLDLKRDLHFQTCTTMDTLDYSGGTVNQGSKIVIAVAGGPKRVLVSKEQLEVDVPGFGRVGIAADGIAVMQGDKYRNSVDGELFLDELKEKLAVSGSWPNGLPILVVVDDPKFVASSFDNFLWVTFTRSDPAQDIYGLRESVHRKHWSCSEPLIIDARIKPHHAPPLREDRHIEGRVDALAEQIEPIHRKYFARLENCDEEKSG